MTSDSDVVLTRWLNTPSPLLATSPPAEAFSASSFTKRLFTALVTSPTNGAVRLRRSFARRRSWVGDSRLRARLPVVPNAVYKKTLVTQMRAWEYGV